MLTVVAKPVPIKTSKVHCIKHVNLVSVQRDVGNELRTMVLAFQRKENAVLMAYILENHRNNTKDWPDMRIGHNKNIDLHITENKLKRTVHPELLSIEDWEFDDLKEYCLQNMLDIYLLKNMKMNKMYNNINMGGVLVQLEREIQYYMDIYNSKYNS